MERKLRSTPLSTSVSPWKRAWVKSSDFIRDLLKRRPRLKYTREGRIFSLVTLGVGLAALNSGNNLLYLVLGLMLALIVGSGFLSSLNLNRIRIKRRFPTRIYANQAILIEYEVLNTKRVWPSFGLHLQIDQTPLYLFLIAPQDAQKYQHTHAFLRRGIYHLEGLHLSTQFPFGFFSKSVHLKLSSTFTVYPNLNRFSLPLEFQNQFDSSVWLVAHTNYNGD